MPRCSNARFDENGWGEAVRDIEELFLRDQDGTNDLNAEAQNVDADQPEGGTNDGGGTSTSTGLKGLCYQDAGSLVAGPATPAVLAGVYTSVIYDTLGGFNTATGVFTAPRDGFYTFDLGAEFTWNSFVAVSGVRVWLATNIAALDHIIASTNPPLGYGSTGIAVTATRRLPAGATVSLNGQGDTAAVTIGGGPLCSFSVTYLGSA